MRILEEKYGRLHISVFHDRVQFFMRDGSRWFSVFYYYNLHAGDKTESKKPIQGKTVREVFRKAFASKRFRVEKRRLFTDEVEIFLKSQWGLGAGGKKTKVKARQILMKLTSPVQRMLDSAGKNLKRGQASPPINFRIFNARRSHATELRLEAAYARGRIVRKTMLAAEGGSISAWQAAERMRISRSTLLRRYRRGRLLGWQEPGEAAVHFPVWQFKGGELLSGLPEVLSALAKGCAELDDMGRIGFFLCQFGFLRRRRPLDMLRKAQIRDALLAAQAFTES